MTARIVVFGATGFTGRLVTAELLAAGHRPVVAGRDQRKVSALAAAHDDLDHGVADAADADSVRSLVGKLVGRGGVLVSTVGPFTRFGYPAVDAAAAVGAHYLDCAGEGAFIRHVFGAAGPRAAENDAALLTGAGFDFVPGNLAAALALRTAGEQAHRVDVGYFMNRVTPHASAISSGTRATAWQLLSQPAHILSAGMVVQRPFARQVRIFHTAGAPPPAALSAGTEQFTLPRIAPGLGEVSTFVGGPDRLVRPAQLASFPLSGLLRLRPGRWAWNRLAEPASRRSGQGPDPDTRARSTTTVTAVVRDAGGREMASTVLAGRDPYTFTGRIMAWIAGHLAAGNVTGRGALGPVDAFGVDELERATIAAGIRRVE